MKTIWTGKSGKAELRIVDTGKLFVALADVNGKRQLEIEAETADEARRRLHEEIGKANPKYVSFAGARNRFLHFFPNGFHSEGYDGEERAYKLRAKDKLETELPLDRAIEASGAGEVVLSIYGATNLLSPFEKMRVRDVLRGPSADMFIRAAARFALGDTRTALAEMESTLKPQDAAKWTVVTYLPFLWRPDAHMFLKPMVTTDFAERIGHRFAQDYEPALKISVYESLLDLVSKTETELSDLKPRDRIDIQSFI
jgi:hypothetical protein